MLNLNQIRDVFDSWDEHNKRIMMMMIRWWILFNTSTRMILIVRREMAINVKSFTEQLLYICRIIRTTYTYDIHKIETYCPDSHHNHNTTHPSQRITNNHLVANQTCVGGGARFLSQIKIKIEMICVPSYPQWRQAIYSRFPVPPTHTLNPQPPRTELKRTAIKSSAFFYFSLALLVSVCEYVFVGLIFISVFLDIGKIYTFSVIDILFIHFISFIQSLSQLYSQ